MNELPEPFEIPKPSERVRVRASWRNSDGEASFRDLGEMRLREDESMLVYFDEEGEPYPVVMPQDEV